MVKLIMCESLVGGELKKYFELMKKVRQSVMDEMIEEAEKLGANGIIGIQFASAQVAGVWPRSSPTAPP